MADDDYTDSLRYGISTVPIIPATDSSDVKYIYYDGSTSAFPTANLPTYIGPNNSTWTIKPWNYRETRQIYRSPDYEGEALESELDKVCSKCKNTVPDYKIAISYGYKKIAKHICHRCNIKYLDKQFGIEDSVDMEDMLYEE